MSTLRKAKAPLPYPSWARRALAFLHDAARCLALVRQGQLCLDPDGKLSNDSLAVLAEQTNAVSVLSPFHDKQECSYDEFLFQLLGHAGLVGAVGEKALLSAMAYEWLDCPPEIQLHQLRQTWFMAFDADWHGLATDSQQRHFNSQWKYITVEAIKAITDLSTTAWMLAPEFIADLETRGIPAWGNVAYNLPTVRQAMERRGQSFLRFLLQEILPCLGLVETESQAGILHLRPTPEGVSWLSAALFRRDRIMTRLSNDTAVELAVPSHELCFPDLESPVVVSQELYLTIPLVAPAACTFEIAHFAHQLTPFPPTRYQITQATLRQAVAWDYRVADVILLLSLFSGGSIPPAALAQLSTWEREMMMISYEPGYRLCLAAPALLELLWQRKPFRDRTQPFASGQEAWVSHAQVSDLFRYLRRLGYTLTMSKDTDDGDDSEFTLWSLRRLGLPLSQLLVILRTYQHLRRTVPGLADLGLEDLERYLDAALSPDDRAAVQCLIESHVAALALSLKRQEGEEMSRWIDEERVEKQEGRLVALVARLQDAIETGVPLSITYADTRARCPGRKVRPF